RMEVDPGRRQRRAVEALILQAAGPETSQRRYELGHAAEALLLAHHLVILRGAPWVPAQPPVADGLPLDDPQLRAHLDVGVLEDPAAKLPDGIWIRTRRPGDRIGPGGASLKQLFIERGLARFLRDRYPLLEDASGLLQVPGLWQRPASMA